MLGVALAGRGRLDEANDRDRRALQNDLGEPVAAARLYAKALAASPQLAGDLHADHRYRAACAAVLTGYGRSGDGAKLSRAERARWRERAREWLRAEITLWTRVLDHGPPADRVLIAQKLAHLWADPDIAGMLEQESLDVLPPGERQECRVLWGEIDALIRRTQTIE